MTEISKMFENAGLIKGGFSFNGELPIIKITPYFTAEKQLLLLQWLLDKTDLYLHKHKTDFTYSIASGDIAVNKYKDFKESIAEIINAYWQSLTDQEKEEIRNILNA